MDDDRSMDEIIEEFLAKYRLPPGWEFIEPEPVEVQEREIEPFISVSNKPSNLNGAWERWKNTEARRLELLAIESEVQHFGKALEGVDPFDITRGL